MKNLRMTLRLLLVASGLALCLSACGGSGSSSSSAGASTAKTVSNVSVRALDGKINISWDKPADSSQSTTGSTLSVAVPTYNIYCSATDPADIVKDSNKIATKFAGQSFDYTDVSNGQRYYCAVTLVTATGEGPASNTVCAAPQAVQPAAPSGLKVTALDSSPPSVKLEFMGPTPPNPANVTYNIYRSTSIADFSSNNPNLKQIEKNLTTFTTTPYIDKDTLSNGTTYYYAVTAVVAQKESGLSPVAAAQPQAKVTPVEYNPASTPPALVAAFGSPTNMSAEPGNRSCVIKWTKSEVPITFGPQIPTNPPVDYRLYWSDSQDDVIAKNIVPIDDIAKNLTADTNNVFNYTLPDLTNGRTYYLQLVAAMKDTGGNTIEGPSGPIVAITPALKTPAVPSGVTATQGSQQVTLTWTKDTSGIPNVTYKIYYSTTELATPAKIVAKGDFKTSDKANFTHSGLDSGKTYYYVITSVGGLGEGESDPSNIIAVTL